MILRYVAALTFKCFNALHQHILHTQEFFDRRHGVLQVWGEGVYTSTIQHAVDRTNGVNPPSHMGISPKFA